MSVVKRISEIYDLAGKTAIVTGGSAGLGFAIASRLSEAGAAVLIVGRNAAAAKDAADRIVSGGGRAQYCEADVGHVSNAQQIAEAALAAFGSIDILVNNAAVFPTMPTLEITETQWDEIFDINLKGVFFLTQAASRQMIAAGRGGKIINVTSVASHMFQPQILLYGASKGGLDGLTLHLAGELAGHGIQVNAIRPGAHATPGMMKMAEGKDVDVGSLLARIPLGRFGEPDDIGKVALFLASSASDYMTASVIDVDGGWSIMA